MSMSDVPQVQCVPIDHKIKYAIENNTYLDIPYRPYAIIYKIENITSYGLICEFNRVNILHTIYTYNKHHKQRPISIDVNICLQYACGFERPEIVKIIAVNDNSISSYLTHFYPDKMTYTWFVLDCIKDNISAYNECCVELFILCIYNPINYEITKRIISYCNTNIISQPDLYINSMCEKIASCSGNQQNNKITLYLMTLDLILNKWSIQVNKLLDAIRLNPRIKIIRSHKLQISMSHRGYMFADMSRYKKALHIINIRKNYLKRYLDSRKRRITLWDTNISNIIMSYM